MKNNIIKNNIKTCAKILVCIIVSLSLILSIKLSPISNSSYIVAADTIITPSGITTLEAITNSSSAIKNKRAKKLIVINAGHQAKANTKRISAGPGSSSSTWSVAGGTTGKYTHIPEYKITLQVAKKLEKSLKEEGYTVYMIRRKNNVNIPNNKRAIIANKKKAKLVISLHCDAARSAVRGFYTLTPVKNKWTKKIYKKSLKASKTIHKAVLKTTKAYDRGITKRGDLAGFNYSKVPTTLLEMGNMSNKKDDNLLKSTKYQKKIVKGVVNGVNKFFML